MKINQNIKINSKYFKFLSFFFILGFIISFIIYKKLDNTLIIKEISNLTTFLNTPINYIFLHFIFISLVITTSLFGLGFITIPLYFMFEIICLFYNLFIFLNIFKLNGLIFGICYNILTKGLYLFLLLIILKKLLILSKKVLNGIFNKKETPENYRDYFKEVSIFVVLILLNDIGIYFLANKILLKLIFFLN